MVCLTHCGTARRGINGTTLSRAVLHINGTALFRSPRNLFRKFYHDVGVKLPGWEWQQPEEH